MPAITTAFISPSNTLGSRIRAKAYGKRVMLCWNHQLSAEGNHRAAAMHLAKLNGWTGTFHGATLERDGTMVWVMQLISSEGFTL